MRILIIGSLGKMGSLTKSLLENYHHQVYGFDHITDLISKTYHQFDAVPEVDIAIDFSSPALLDQILTFSKKRQIPVVIATTGYSNDQMNSIHEHATHLPVFYSANYSYGVAIMNKVLKEIAKDLCHDFDMEIIEKHHANKKDAPSGTSLLLAQTINSSIDEPKKIVYSHHELRNANDLAIHAVRGGSIVGEHTVLFAGDDEMIEISHIAQSKRIFALGAIKAMYYLINQKPGLYHMENLLKEHM